MSRLPSRIACPSPRPAFIRPVCSAARSFDDSSSVLVDSGREICFLHSFPSLPHTAARVLLAPSPRYPLPVTRYPCYSSYTRSLTCNNLLFRQFPFSRQPSHPSRHAHPSLPYLRTKPLPIWTPCLFRPRTAFLRARHSVAIAYLVASAERPTLHGRRACLFHPQLATPLCPHLARPLPASQTWHCIRVCGPCFSAASHSMSCTHAKASRDSG
jgi:hypothetical protein